VCGLVSHVVIVAIRRDKAKARSPRSSDISSRTRPRGPRLHRRGLAISRSQTAHSSSPWTSTLRGCSTCPQKSVSLDGGGGLENEHAHLDSNIDLRPLNVHSSVILDDSWYSVKVIIMVAGQVVGLCLMQSLVLTAFDPVEVRDTTFRCGECMMLYL